MSLDVEQGTDDWHAARLGKATASRIADALARTKTGWGASRENYKAQLVAERLTGQVADSFQSAEMRRGSELEADAVLVYSFLKDANPVVVGFVDHPTVPMSGASPDRLVGDHGLIEVKCPNTSTHIATLLAGGEPSSRYRLQMQWQMACTGRAWCDFVSYDPRMPEHMQLSVLRIERDKSAIATLEDEIAVFLREVDETVARLREKFGDG